LRWDVGERVVEGGERIAAAKFKKKVCVQVRDKRAPG
jgi:hypothetical protein